MPDISTNVEMTAAYCNFYRTDLGRFALEFDSSGAASERILAKDPTGGSQAGNCFHLEILKLVCTSGEVRLFDGSGGVSIFEIPGIVEMSRGRDTPFSLDFRPDSLRCLTADNTQSLCISAGNGFWSGFVTGWFGNA